MFHLFHKIHYFDQTESAKWVHFSIVQEGSEDLAEVQSVSFTDHVQYANVKSKKVVVQSKEKKQNALWDVLFRVVKESSELLNLYPEDEDKSAAEEIIFAWNLF